MKENIQIIDLPALHAPIQKELNRAIENVLVHQQFIGGPEVAKFENELGNYLNASVLGVGNGTDALEIALLTLGIGPGDEVLVPSFSYFASAEVVVRVGAKPVFVDINSSFIIDVKEAEKKITRKTKALIVVHLFGLCAEMDSILSFAKQNNLWVVEDAAQAIGATCKVEGIAKMAGTMGDMGTISFFPSKNLGAFGDGGAIVSNSEELIKKSKMIAQHGQSSKYVHDCIGMNSRLDTIQAAILRVKLKHLNIWTKERVRIAHSYTEVFKNQERIVLPEIPQNSSHVYHQYTFCVKGNRELLKASLLKVGIPVRLYYPKAIHQQKAFKTNLAIHLTNTEKVQEQMISIPIHPTLNDRQVQFIIDNVREYSLKC
ncbi:MAG: DegT/DnrJ/EryC1/StrS family aminotransferase [Salibacteraceae bacterium]